MKKVVLLMLLLILALVVAIPAGATPPEDIVIHSTSHYSFFDFANPTGTWDSSGVVESSGKLEDVPVHFGAGWPHGIGFKNAHVIEVISDDNGTITIRSIITGVEWEYFDNEACASNPFFQRDEQFKGSGNWVILSGTGAYKNLHGQGNLMSSGDVSCENMTMDIVTTYEGMAHFDSTK